MNVCIFSGRLTRDAETKYAQSGTAVSKFSIAVDSGFGDYKRTDFINCTLFKRENLAQYLTKGKPVILSGELQTEKWQDKDGNQKTGFSIIVRDIDFQTGDSAQQSQQSSEQAYSKLGSPF